MEFNININFETLNYDLIKIINMGGKLKAVKSLRLNISGNFYLN